MSDEQRSLVFSSELREVETINSSFDRGIMRIAYWGANHNNTYISKQAFVDAIPSIYNCPIVCNYDRESDSIGGHDMEIVKSNGSMRLVNLTTPVGVVPESAEAFWENVEEDDGSVHEYLCMPVLLWKRQEAYAHIRDNGVTSQSMEIRVISSHRNSGDSCYYIDSFEFTALCIIECTPCFESASIEVFSYNGFQERLAAMMDDFKREFTKVTTTSVDDIGAPAGAVDFSKGGCDPLNVQELMLRYGLTEQDIDFEVAGMEAEELEQRFAEIRARLDAPENAVFEDDGDGSQDGEGGDDSSEGVDATDVGDDDDEGDVGQDDTPEDDEPEDDPDDDDDDDDGARRRNYSLTGEQFVSELLEQLHSITYVHPDWGEMWRYGYVDYDPAVNEVYVYDYTDWKLYGLSYSMNGDNVVIDQSARKRKKFAFVDFDMGNEQFCYKNMLEGVSAQFEKMGSELKELREFKSAADEAARTSEVNELFAKFAALDGNEMFEALKKDNAGYSLSDLEDKCYAIRGRTMEMKFSAEPAQGSTRVPADTHSRVDEEPYGGVFVRYGIGAR